MARSVTVLSAAACAELATPTTGVVVNNYPRVSRESLKIRSKRREGRGGESEQHVDLCSFGHQETTPQLSRPREPLSLIFIITVEIKRCFSFRVGVKTFPQLQQIYRTTENCVARRSDVSFIVGKCEY